MSSPITGRSSGLTEHGGAVPAIEIGNAIGSTEPTAEERCHRTPEMSALAVRDGEAVTAGGCEDKDDAQGAARP